MVFINWLANIVQTLTGEKERRQLVEKLRKHFVEFKKAVKELVGKQNEAIHGFNEKIKELNAKRQDLVTQNIWELNTFLSRFGKVKDWGEYCEENEKELVEVSEQQFEGINKYIAEVDWNKQDVFIDSFILSPIGMKIKTRKQNLSMREKLNEFKLAAEETANQLSMLVFSIGVEQEICELYMQIIAFIVTYIDDKILPELHFVESFFQVLHIKDKIISGRKLQEIEFKNQVVLIKDTIYSKHYYFIKNAFVFYVFSCKVYNTPILTRLFNNQSTDADYAELNKYNDELIYLGEKVDDNIFIKEKNNKRKK